MCTHCPLHSVCGAGSSTCARINDTQFVNSAKWRTARLDTEQSSRSIGSSPALPSSWVGSTAVVHPAFINPAILSPDINASAVASVNCLPDGHNFSAAGSARRQPTRCAAMWRRRSLRCRQPNGAALRRDHQLQRHLTKRSYPRLVPFTVPIALHAVLPLAPTTCVASREPARDHARTRRALHRTQPAVGRVPACRKRSSPRCDPSCSCRSGSGSSDRTP